MDFPWHLNKMKIDPIPFFNLTSFILGDVSGKRTENPYMFAYGWIKLFSVGLSGEQLRPERNNITGSTLLSAFSKY